ncbi:uncharacterized protein G2W53_034016 [Senna tora]|uniref:Uncharacterized protein n=1 Tax=Senna tora TaxID=362788 RepID=A0A834SZN8_9FABA|nr:uncharacterized protein G2W53_034016 [Senna tora]
MWSSEDVNGVAHLASSRLSCACSVEMPWGRSKKSTGTLFTRRNKLVKSRIQASAEHLGSAEDPVKQNGKTSYHPFEEITVSASEHSEDARLTAAETSRTIIEVNSKATLMFSNLINDEAHENIIWPDLPYLTDEHGNIYFQVKSGEDIMQSLTSENNFVLLPRYSVVNMACLFSTLQQVIVGVDTMEMISEMDLSDEDEQDDADETLEGWAKLETMHSSSDPMYFAKKLAEIASDDPIDWMEQPPACLAIQGLLRPAFIEEQSVIQKHLSTNQSNTTDTSEPLKDNGEDPGAINGLVHKPVSSKDNAAQVENSDIPANVTSFFKLEMVKIQLFSAHGHPTDLEVEEYMKAQPDAIAHSASKIISRVKADGEKTTQALKSLCWRCKGIQVEVIEDLFGFGLFISSIDSIWLSAMSIAHLQTQEAQLISVDSLGFDLRVCSGTKVQTLRFGFKKRATSEYSAERQLNDVLFPRVQKKQQKMKQTHQNES